MLPRERELASKWFEIRPAWSVQTPEWREEDELFIYHLVHLTLAPHLGHAGTDPAKTTSVGGKTYRSPFLVLFKR